MSEIPNNNREYFQGEDAPAEWIASDKKEIQDIGNDTLRTEIQLLARLHDKAITHERLIKSYERMEEMVRSGQIGIEVAGIWMDKIANKDQSLVEPQVQQDIKQKNTPRPQEKNDFSVEKLADVLGVPGTEEQIARFRGAEANMVPFQFSVGSEPKFFNSLTDREKDMWRSRALLSTIAGNKKMAAGYEDLGKNYDARAFTKSDLINLLCNGETNEDSASSFEDTAALRALGIYAYAIKENLPFKQILYPYEWNKLSEEQKRQELTPQDITDGSKFAKMKEMVRDWLSVKIMLEKIDETPGREGKLKMANLDKTDARVAREYKHATQVALDAENIAWNLMYFSGMVEEYDTRFDENGRNNDKTAVYKVIKENGNDVKRAKGRIPPAVSQYKSMALWMLMHPQERFEAKMGASNPDLSQPVKKDDAEAWSVFGAWGSNRVKNKNWDPRREPFLPKRLFTNIFKDSKMKFSLVAGANLNESDQQLFGSKKDGRISFESYLVNLGKQLKNDPKANTNIDKIEWSEFNNTPFSSYMSDSLGSAITIFGIFDGGGWKDSWDKLGDVCNKLGFDNNVRELLLKAIRGIDVNADSSVPEPYGRGFFNIDWNSHVNAVKDFSPTFFKR